MSIKELQKKNKKSKQSILIKYLRSNPIKFVMENYESCAAQEV